MLMITAKAQAGLVILSEAAELSPEDVVTAPYSGAGLTSVPTPYLVSAGGDTLTFTGQLPTLLREDVDVASGMDFDFPDGTHLLDARSLSAEPAGPLMIAFSIPVTEFGLFAQSDGFDTETLSFTAYDGTTALGSYTSPATDNTSESGAAIFLGARATGGDAITHVVISSASSAPGFTNRFVVGPVTISAAPVPEPSALVLFGTATTCLVVAAGRRKR